MGDAEKGGGSGAFRRRRRGGATLRCGPDAFETKGFFRMKDRVFHAGVWALRFGLPLFLFLAGNPALAEGPGAGEGETRGGKEIAAPAVGFGTPASMAPSPGAAGAALTLGAAAMEPLVLRGEWAKEAGKDAARKPAPPAGDSAPLLKGDSVLLRLRFRIPVGWHINSHLPLDSFSLPARLTAEAPGLLPGRPRFPSPVEKFVASLGSRVSLFEGEVSVEWPFALGDSLKDRLKAAGPARASAVLDSALGHAEVTLHYQACSDALCMPPKEARWSAGGDGASGAKAGTGIPGGASGIGAGSGDAGEAASKPEKTPAKGSAGPALAGTPLDLSGGFFGLFFALLLFGLALNLTPCVYPMIAITVSLFGGQKSAPLPAKFLLASLYVLGIVITFSGLGVFAALSGNLFGSVLQSQAAQLLIVAVFVAMALGSFGLFDIRLPSGLMGKAMNASNAGGYAGALLAGLFSGVLASPCIGPVVLGLLLAVAEKGSVGFGLFAFATLALGMGIPYLLLGTSSSLLHRMPKSGEWMVEVKRILGVVLLALANYYARGFVGDRVHDFILGLLLLYGALYVNPFHPLPQVGAPLAAALRLLALLALLFGLHYATRSLFGASVFDSRSAGRAAVLGPPGTAGTSGITGPSGVTGGGGTRARERLEWAPFSEAALAEAKAEGRPVLIDFLSKVWCAACREMEEKTFSDAGVQAALYSHRLLAVDVDKHPEAKALQKRYGVYGIPTLVLVGPDGGETGRMVGFVPPEEFLRKL